MRLTAHRASHESPPHIQDLSVLADKSLGNNARHGSPVPTGDQMKIVIVDDSTAMRMIVKKTLRQAGFEGHVITEAEDGAKALASISASVPDLVLSDWNMPNMTGFELLQALRAKGIAVTFGFITTEATPDMRAKAMGAGAKFLISKPFTPESFQEHLGPYIH
jgi:two-component system chemotaxis response regulator CheY